LTLAHYTGGAWVNEAATATGTVTAGSVATNTAVTSYSPFALGSTNVVTSPLPIVLRTFDAYEKGVVNEIAWETDVERNVKRFEIEKSTDAQHWQTIGNVLPNQQKHYQLTDNQPAKVSYYRLKNVDNDGRSEYSQTVSVLRKSNTFDIIDMFPNPTSENLTIRFENIDKEEIQVNVIDIVGKIVLTQTLTTEKGINQASINSANLPSGQYILQLSNTTQRLNRKFVKQ
jgi:Secretion system C-terminal sorting domain